MKGFEKDYNKKDAPKSQKRARKTFDEQVVGQQFEELQEAKAARPESIGKGQRTKQEDRVGLNQEAQEVLEQRAAERERNAAEAAKKKLAEELARKAAEELIRQQQRNLNMLETNPMHQMMLDVWRDPVKTWRKWSCNGAFY